MFSTDDVAYIARNIPRDVVIYEIRPRTILSSRSRLGLRETIVSFPVEVALPYDNRYTSRYILGRACENGHGDVVRILLADPRVEPSAIDNQAIRCASWFGYSEVVKLLLADPRVDPTVWDNAAISMASYRGHLEVVKMLLADPRVGVSRSAHAVLAHLIHRMPSDAV